MSTALIPRDGLAAAARQQFAARVLLQRRVAREGPEWWHPPVEAAMQAHWHSQAYPEQDAFVVSSAPRRIVRAGRRAGKTVGVARIGGTAFLQGRRVLYAVPTQEQVDRFWTEIKRVFAVPIADRTLYKNETRHVLELPGTETRIRAKTAFNADTLRGDYADLLILDEFQLMHESAWNDVGAPMLADHNGKAVFIYTPASSHNLSRSQARDPRHAAKLYRAHEHDTTGHWQCFTFASHANPYISAMALDELSHDMTLLAYRREILAQESEEIPGALWTQKLLDGTRVEPGSVPDYVRIAIALDPAVSSAETSAEMGIVACARGVNNQGYVLRDASMHGTPMACARQAIFLYDSLNADVLVGEGNNGGEWIGTVIDLVAKDMHTKGERSSPHVSYKMVYASRNKQTRAEPISALYERDRVHHVGVLFDLEEQLANWVPGMKSPDRLDAAVWALTELMLGAQVSDVGAFGRSNATLLQTSGWR